MCVRAPAHVCVCVVHVFIMFDFWGLFSIQFFGNRCNIWPGSCVQSSLIGPMRRQNAQ